MCKTDYCCDGIKQIMERFDGPFYYPVRIDENRDMVADRLAAPLYNLTPSKKAISSKGSAALFLSYCPICGVNLEGPDHDRARQTD